ncbi:MAG: hypothetical protein ACJ79S_01900 [Gemmatimonadaceae bacterium]
MTAPAIGTALELPARTVRDHLAILTGRGIVAAHGERRGRYYTPASVAEEVEASLSPDSGTNPILVVIYERGGRISRDDLRALVEEHGYDPGVVGVLHGRRLAHLQRDPGTGDGLLTTRGEKVAKQALFTNRLVRGACAEQDGGLVE